MSNYAQGWAWQQPVGGSDKLVLVALADHADDDGICWPGQKGVATKCGLSKRTVTAAIARLTEARILAVEERLRPDGSRTSNRYHLLLTGGGGEDTSPPGEPNNTGGVKETTLGGEAIGGTGTQIEPSVETKEEPSINTQQPPPFIRDKFDLESARINQAQQASGRG